MAFGLVGFKQILATRFTTFVCPCSPSKSKCRRAKDKREVRNFDRAFEFGICVRRWKVDSNVKFAPQVHDARPRYLAKKYSKERCAARMCCGGREILRAFLVPSSSTVGCGPIQFGTGWNDPRRIDRLVTLIVMSFVMVEIDGLGDPRRLI